LNRLAASGGATAAAFVCLFLNGVAGAEDYSLAGLRALPPLASLSGLFGMVWENPFCDVSDMVCTSLSFARAVGVRGSGESLTLGHLMDILQRPLLDWELAFVRRNFGHYEWAVAAVLVFLEAIPGALRHFVFLDSGVVNVPLRDWESIFSVWLVFIKRCPYLLDCGNPPEEVLLLRKLLNIVSRSDVDADWSQDYLVQNLEPQVHYTLTPDWRCNQLGYVPALVLCLQELLPQVVGNNLLDGDLSDLSEWWSKRAIWAPSGSSSDKSSVDHMFKDHQLTSEDRPNKKVVFCELPDSAPFDVLASPPMSVARGSTKNEPGEKNRALWATNDQCFVVASYASHNIEKYVNIDGIRAKQAPSDVFAWVQQSFTCALPQRWLSLDYSDFNKEHEMLLLFALNVELAAAWLEAPVDYSVVRDKVRCSLWQAEAHLCKVAVGPELPPYRVFGGLFTGCRDTARDHALLHWAYSTHAMRLCRHVVSDFVLIDKNFTGDDEDTLLVHWAAALLYLCAHMMVGHTIKAKKQVSSSWFHEYLQRLVGIRTAPLRPLCATLSALSSGQWYKDTHKWYDNIVQSLSDSLWDAHCRGLPLLLARRWAVAFISRQMRVKLADGSVKLLEWWTFRHGSSGVHPLWVGTWGVSAPMPAIDAKPMPKYANMLGLDSLFCWRRRQMPNISFDEQNYRRLLAPEVYSSLYARARAEAHILFAQVHWPERYSKPLLDAFVDPVFAGEQWLLQTHRAFPPPDRRPATLDEVLGRMGLDSMFVGAAGGIKAVLLKLPPSKLNKFEIPIGKLQLPLFLRKLDPAIQSVLSTMRSLPIPEAQRILGVGPGAVGRRLPALRYNSPHSFSREYVLNVVYAPNGSGKSTFCERVPGSVDFDVLIAAAHAQGSIHATSKQGILKTSRSLDLLAASLQNSSVEWLLGQYPIHEYLSGVSALPRIRVWLVDVDPRVLRERLLARGWTLEKIERRLSRWVYIRSMVDSMDKAAPLFFPHQLLSLDVVESFSPLMPLKEAL